MRIALLGYGKMGKVIEEIALNRGHDIVEKVNSSNPIENINPQEIDVAIEFSRPELAVHHINYCINHQVPIVVGTTAWLEHLPEITSKVQREDGALLYASNFSIGVNLFFELNRKLAKLMNNYPAYSVEMEEIHHTEKLDAPSGTAISLASDIIANHQGYTNWSIEEVDDKEIIPIEVHRLPQVPGTHSITYDSEVDRIVITHEAHNRKGFALGAVVAAEFLQNKKGVFTMSDLLKNA